MMAGVVYPFMEVNLQMKTSMLNTLREDYCQWLMQDQIPMALNFSLLLFLVIGITFSTHLLNRLDGKHVVFGELIEGDNVLKMLEMGGS